MKELEELIDWQYVMDQPRCVGGHEEVMRAIFGTASVVLAWWSNNDYQGTIAIAHKLNDGRVVVMTDYYGSCNTCDMWVGATDEDVRKLVLDLVHHAKTFSTVGEAADWCANIDAHEEPHKYPFKAAKYLVEQLMSNEKREIKGNNHE